MGWFWNINELPELPHAGHLVQVLAQHEFQEAFKNYRDLLFLAKNLQQWRENLGVFGDMLSNRRLAYVERLPRVRAQEGAIGLVQLGQRRDDLARDLTWVEAHSNVFALADPKERELGARLGRIRATLDQAGGSPELDPARERYRRASGALTWQLTQEYPVRLWDAKKQLKELGVQIDQARGRDVALGQAQRDEPAHFEQFATRILELDRRIRELIPRVADLTRRQKHFVQELAVAELQHQKDQLAAYATQAGFAVARGYDGAPVEKEADHAAGH
jgi:DNA repair ATPase RecN